MQVFFIFVSLSILFILRNKFVINRSDFVLNTVCSKMGYFWRRAKQTATNIFRRKWIFHFYLKFTKHREVLFAGFRCTIILLCPSGCRLGGCRLSATTARSIFHFARVQRRAPDQGCQTVRKSNKTCLNLSDFEITCPISESQNRKDLILIVLKIRTRLSFAKQCWKNFTVEWDMLRHFRANVFSRGVKAPWPNHWKKIFWHFCVNRWSMFYFHVWFCPTS